MWYVYTPIITDDIMSNTQHKCICIQYRSVVATLKQANNIVLKLCSWYCSWNGLHSANCGTWFYIILLSGAESCKTQMWCMETAKRLELKRQPNCQTFSKSTNAALLDVFQADNTLHEISTSHSCPEHDEVISILLRLIMIFGYCPSLLSVWDVKWNLNLTGL